MLHETVSFLDSTAQQVRFGLALRGSQHPLTVVGILLLFVLLVVMLCAEYIETRITRFHEAPPIRLKR